MTMNYNSPQRDLLDDFSTPTSNAGDSFDFFQESSAPPPPQYGSEAYYAPPPPTALVVSPSSSTASMHDAVSEEEPWSYSDHLDNPNNRQFDLSASSAQFASEKYMIAPDVDKLKKKRRRNTTAAGVVGGAVGLVVLGPLGMVAGGAGAALATKHIGKRKERRRMRKHQQAVMTTASSPTMSNNSTALAHMRVVAAESAVLA